MQFFGCDHGKAFRQIETHLVTKNAEGAGACSVFFFGAVFEHMPHEVVVLFHNSENETKKSKRLAMHRFCTLRFQIFSHLLTA